MEPAGCQQKDNNNVCTIVSAIISAALNSRIDDHRLKIYTSSINQARDLAANKAKTGLSPLGYLFHRGRKLRINQQVTG
jgi:hypothetical protein